MRDRAAFRYGDGSPVGGYDRRDGPAVRGGDDLVQLEEHGRGTLGRDHRDLVLPVAVDIRIGPDVADAGSGVAIEWPGHDEGARVPGGVGDDDHEDLEAAAGRRAPGAARLGEHVRVGGASSEEVALDLAPAADRGSESVNGDHLRRIV